ncbi:methyl-accepting chemotaxis protein [Parasalinivibrio latis]|uniref:methyl-accepting chemotaxis protein n=1 Tax=Parasalinivibrio latis TaxID=2952610 RepID=UPI0030DF5291
MLSKFKLAQQLTFSFAAVLGLLLVVAVVGYRGLSGGYQNFTEYRGLARSSNQSSAAQSALVTARLDVLKFLKTQAPEQIDKFDNGYQTIVGLLDQMLDNDQSSTRDAMLTEARSGIDEYKAAFENVIQDFAKRNEVVKGQLDPNGLAMRRLMTEIIESAYSRGDQSTVFYASRVQEKLLLGRLFAAKYLISNSESDFDRSMLELNAVNEPLENLLSSMSTADRNDKGSKFEKAHDSYIDALGKVASIIRERNERISGTLDVIGPKITKILTDFSLSIKAAQDTLGPRAQSESESAVDFVILISGFAVLAGVVLSYMVTKAIRKPIGGEPRDIEAMARKIANGDLTMDFGDTSKATGIYAAMAEMANSLRQIIGQLSGSADSLNGASNTLVSVTNDTVQNSESQADQLAQTASAMHQMTITVDDIAKNSQQASDIANVADGHVREGQAVLEDTRLSIDKLVTNIGDVSNIIENLERETENVGSILDVIRGIAEQTNLLALNAAIEAARAGEQGRGFAVVADEVRSLASRTQQSTEEIQELIVRLQKESKRSVDSMRLNVQEATDTSQKAHKTSEALQAITESVASIRDMSHQIAVAAEEQNTVVTNINNNVEEINHLARSTATGAESVSAEANGLSKITSGLNQIVGKFSIS